VTAKARNLRAQLNTGNFVNLVPVTSHFERGPNLDPLRMSNIKFGEVSPIGGCSLGCSIDAVIFNISILIRLRKVWIEAFFSSQNLAKSPKGVLAGEWIWAHG
jgi:hypothetical protein